jgi:hypothetical protein
MINNPKQYAKALRNPQSIGMQAPAAIPHNFGVPNGGSPVPMPSGGISMPAPPRTPETYRPQPILRDQAVAPTMPAGNMNPVGGNGFAAQPAPIVQGRMPIPRAPIPAVPRTGLNAPNTNTGVVPPRAY